MSTSTAKMTLPPKTVVALFLLGLSYLANTTTCHAAATTNAAGAHVAPLLAKYSLPTHLANKSRNSVPLRPRRAAYHDAFRTILASDVIKQFATTSRLGLTLEPCEEDFDCLASRICIDPRFGNSGEPCTGDSGAKLCVCVPPNPLLLFCSCINPCMPGDMCARTSRGNGVCIFGSARVPPLRCRNTPQLEGFSLEVCSRQRDCAVGRVCTGPPDCATEQCRCFPLDQYSFCDCENPFCLEGDVCSFDPLDETPLCASKALQFPVLECPDETPEPSFGPPTPTSEELLSPTPAPTLELTEEVCVDARMLSGFDPNELVYEKHPVSRVLCDRSGSCATPGHIVHYKGSAMMMKSYCEVVGCEKAVMEVNSPKYRRGVRVGSKTDGLHFTAFAARYGTRSEEGLMAFAVRIGL